jgi:hypothetical protein
MLVRTPSTSVAQVDWSGNWSFCACSISSPVSSRAAAGTVRRESSAPNDSIHNNSDSAGTLCFRGDRKDSRGLRRNAEEMTLALQVGNSTRSPRNHVKCASFAELNSIQELSRDSVTLLDVSFPVVRC